jgi:protein gp37
MVDACADRATRKQIHGELTQEGINMGVASNIQWTDHTINFWTGCTKVSPGCKFCYMYRDKERYGLDPTQLVRVKAPTISKVLRTAKPGDKIFTCSWSDFFIEDADQWRQEAWDLIISRDDLIFQILTKRPERIKECLPPGGLPANVWIGVSVETQPFLRRVSPLMAYDSTIFLSIEPMIGPVDVRMEMILDNGGFLFATAVDWVIVGGESGNDNGKWKYRECKIEWIEKVIEDCAASEVPVFVKQLGTHLAKKLNLKDRHGGDISEWPEHLRVRQFPQV